MSAPVVVVAPDVAAQEFNRMCGAYRINIDPEKLEPSELLSLALIKQVVVEAIGEGRFLVKEDGRPTYTPRTEGAERIHFKRPTGACFMAMDEAGEKHYTRLARAATELTGSVPGAISKLEADDFNFVIALTRLFLAQG